ncbi:hypothetical protein [Streptomyces sp. NPDC002889]|uniref:hypothetical protein n=1 Tax=Streptomyces sp. NPDC002889 TaxID=3364669 RepID=UPI0036CB596B
MSWPAGHGLPRQTVLCTATPEAGVDPPEFFPNLGYRPTPAGRLVSHLDLGLRAFINELDEGLDPVYFIGRASGDQFRETVLGRCFFSRPEAQLRQIKEWLLERNTVRPLTLVTGSPGSGKSALQGSWSVSRIPNSSLSGDRSRPPSGRT